jgi:hypothetical protein
MSRITAVLAGLVIACFAVLAPTAAHASTSADTIVQPDGTRVTATPSRIASVQASGNANATVIGVGFCSNLNVKSDCWTNVNPSTGTACPTGHFCIYTKTTAAAGGKVFSFYHCRNGGSDWALQAWDDWGFYHNSNTGNAHGFIKDNNHRTLTGGDIPVGGRGTFYYLPAWFVQACTP